MDWKQFTVDLVSSIAWPFVAITFLFVFRSELAKIIQRLAHLKYNGLEVDFEKVKQQAEELQLEHAQDIPANENPILASLEDQIMDAVDIS